MAVDESNGNNASQNTDEYYEKAACEEEIYDEDVEEEVRDALVSDNPSPAQKTHNKDAREGEISDEELQEAAEELITGDADDPPAGEDNVAGMLSVSRLYSLQALLLQGHAILPLLIQVGTWF